MTTVTEMIEVHSPYDGSLVAEIELDSKEKVFSAIDKMHKNFLDRVNWIPVYKRIQLFESFLEEFASSRDELVYTAIKEGGKPKKDTEAEFDRALEGIKIVIRELQNFTGEIIPMELNQKSEQHFAFTKLEPKGLVFAISAFNHPINLIIHQVIPAIAVGCPVIIKPASKTPVTCKKIVELLYKAGLDENWLKFILCSNETSTAVVESEKISFLSFIGSEKVGWNLRSKLAPGASCALEHGGVAPAIIDKDVELTSVIEPLTKAAFYHAGQVCVSLQRLYVHEDIFDETLALMKEKITKLKLGDPLDNETDLGPLISKDEYERVTEWVAEARDNSEEVFQSHSTAGEYNLYPPTLVVNPNLEVKLSTEEAFGPILCIYKYSCLNEAIKLANSLPYSFQASIFTNDLRLATKAAHEMKAMTVLINQHTAFRVDWMPFAGAERSGLGCGGIKYTMRELVNKKQVILNGAMP